MKTDKHDGLVVIISSHGIQDYIITSDYKQINKDTIHRIFSVDHPTLRDIPGIFIYDCCDGDNDISQEPIKRSHQHQISKGNDITDEIEEKTELRKVTNIYGTDSDIWVEGDPNPDYKLPIINSSNKGFVSQMGSKSGSFMIKKLTEGLRYNICDNNNKLFLFELFHEIQEELHDKNIQLIETKYNNRLEYIKFETNEDLPSDGAEFKTVLSESNVDKTLEMETFNRNH